MSRPLRVLLLLHELSRTGAPMLGLDAFEAMPDLDVRIISLAGGPLESRARSIGPLTILRPGTSGSVRKAASIAGEVTLTHTGALSRWADVVYVNSIAALPSVRRLRLKTVPIVLHVHEGPVLLASLADAHGLQDDLRAAPSRYIAVSGVVRSALVDEHGVDPARVSVVPPFVRPEQPSTTESGPHASFTVGGVGYVNWYKGVDLWLLAAAAVARQLGSHEIRFVWLGLNGQGARQFDSMVRKLELTEVVTGLPSTDRPLDTIRAFDMLALTSWEDAAPRVVLEAMSLGKPVACFAAGGGAPELIGDTGIIVTQFSPDAMAREIIALAGARERAQELGQRGRERARSEFAEADHVARIRAVIAEAAARPL